MNIGNVQHSHERPPQHSDTTLQQISILQFNCGAANYGVSRPIFDAASPDSHSILAVQEPAFNKRTMTTYCPKGYTLAYDPSPMTKVCFLIGDQLHTSHWSYQAHSPYVASLRLKTAYGPLELINVYNPRDNGPRIKTWATIAKVIEAASGEVILLGDFNAHHPEWGGDHSASEPQSEHLLLETRRRGLHLLNPRGVATWRRGQRESVIDLIFSSELLKDSVIRCDPREDWAIAQDHIPINVQFSIGILPKPPCKRFALNKLDKPGLLRYLEESGWQTKSDPLDALQRAICEGLEMNCPRVKRCPRASQKWSPRASELLAGARRARRAFALSGLPQDSQAQKSHQNLLKKELRRGSRTVWRKFVEEFSSDTQLPNNKGLWKLSRWSRSVANGPRQTQMPPLRRSDREPFKWSNEEKAELLRENLFPMPPQADLSDLTAPHVEREQLNIPSEISAETVARTISRLPNGKAAGPDGIPNELLKLIAPDIKEDLAQAINRLLTSGSLPTAFKESTTAVLRKDRKADYSLPTSYRPIALQNSLAKLVEKIVADRITETIEEKDILPWNQMGARKKRSTLSAIDLLTGYVQTAWKAQSGCVVSMLSLDISGAFPNTSHERLCWVLERKGFPPWVVHFVQDFLRERRTRLTFSGFESAWFPMKTGIPQGSPLSPILFLLFIAELLESLQQPTDKTLGFGFVDDTNLIAWGSSARDNCRRLDAAHAKCVAWAKRYGAKFAPDKYQLIHFTRKRRDPSGDLASSIRVNGHEVKPEAKLRILGVHVDPKLNWKEHIKEQVGRGTAAFEALSRLATSTFGPSMRKARLIYMATVRPAMMYGAQVWSIQEGEAPKASDLRPLKTIQNKCLRSITGGYKRTPTVALEREACVPPLDLYTEATALQRAVNTTNHPVYKNISGTLDTIWSQLKRTGRGRRGALTPRPPTGLERARQRAAQRIEESQRDVNPNRIRDASQTRRRSSRPHANRDRGPPRKAECALSETWLKHKWKERWTNAANGKTAATWNTPWSASPLRLYDNLPKHCATALMLLRTEVIGLNAWLASVGVPDVLPPCGCGWQAQTVRHVLLHCPNYEQQRVDLIRDAGSEDLQAILTHAASARAAARWFVRCGILEQFRTAHAINAEDIAEYAPFRALE